MGGLVSIVLVGSVVAYIMYQNINNVTKNIEKKSPKAYDFFATLAGSAIEYIKDIKRDINGKRENPEFFVTIEKEKALSELDDFIRKLTFYETALARRKSTEEIEKEIAEIFIQFDEFLSKSFKDGEQKADNLRESLQKIYKNR